MPRNKNFKSISITPRLALLISSYEDELKISLKFSTHVNKSDALEIAIKDSVAKRGLKLQLFERSI